MSENSDTDLTAVTLKVGNWPPLSMTFTADPVFAKGTVLQPNNSVYDGLYSFGTNLTFIPVVQELCEPVALAYSITNTSSPNTLETAIVKGTEGLLNEAAKAAAVAVGGPALLGSVVGGAVAAFIDWASPPVTAQLGRRSSATATAARFWTSSPSTDRSRRSREARNSCRGPTQEGRFAAIPRTRFTHRSRNSSSRTDGYGKLPY